MEEIAYCITTMCNDKTGSRFYSLLLILNRGETNHPVGRAGKIQLPFYTNFRLIGGDNQDLSVDNLTPVDLLHIEKKAREYAHHFQCQFLFPQDLQAKDA